jgi:hypothetical protein
MVVGGRLKFEVSSHKPCLKAGIRVDSRNEGKRVAGSIHRFLSIAPVALFVAFPGAQGIPWSKRASKTRE